MRGIRSYAVMLLICQLAPATYLTSFKCFFVQEQVRKPLQGDMMSLLDKARSDTWSAVDAIVRKHCSRGVEELRSAIDSYQLDGDTKNALVSTLLAFIRQLVTKTVKDEALPRSVLAKMISR